MLERTTNITTIFNNVTAIALAVSTPTIYIVNEVVTPLPQLVPKFESFLYIAAPICLLILLANNIFLRKKQQPLNNTIIDLNNTIGDLNNEIDFTFDFYKRWGDLIRNAVCGINENKRSHAERLKNANSKEELLAIRNSYTDAYQRLFCTPAMELVNDVRKIMIRNTKRTFNIDEDFRVVFKIAHTDDDDREKWEFSNSIWDKNTWSKFVQYHPKKHSEKYLINSNSAIHAITKKKIHFYVNNDLSDSANSNYDFDYTNHNNDGSWKDNYNSKAITAIENKNKGSLYGFLSIDSLNTHKKNLFGMENSPSIPCKVSLFASEILTIFLAEVEIYLEELTELYDERKGSIVHKNRRPGEYSL